MARPRLAAQLERRWHHRVVTIVAGPGFGKTALLALSSRSDIGNRQSVWLTCEPEDEAADHLVEGLAAALGLPRGADLDAVMDAVWARAPTEVCLVLDDVHEVPRDSGGAAVLESLVTGLAVNAHIVFASRDAIPVPLGRRAVSGQLLRLGEQDLVFDDAELARFASVRKVDPDLLSSTAGWPALAELMAATSADLVSDYLWEEVLGRIGDRRAGLLARLIAVGGGDDQIVSAIAGEPLEVDELVASVPLVDRSSGGWAVLHPLWNPALRRLISPEDAAIARRQAAAVHRIAGRYSAASTLLVEAEAWDELLAMMLEAEELAPVTAPHSTGRSAPFQLSSSELGRWLRELPARYRDAPEAKLAAGVDLMGRAPARGADLLAAAADDFRALGQADAELAAIAREGLARWWLNDFDRLFALHQRAAELAAAGSPRAQALTAIGEAAIAHLLGDSSTVLARLEPLGEAPAEWPTTVQWFRSVAHRRNGDLDASMRELDRAAAISDDPQIHLGRLRARWLMGDIDVVLEGLSEIRACYERIGDAFLWKEVTLELAAKVAWLGDPAAARDLIKEASTTLPDETSELVRVLSAITEAAIAIADGDERLAWDAIQAQTEGRSVEPGGPVDWYWHDRAAGALLQMLATSSIAGDGAARSRVHSVGPELARALAAVRAGDRNAARAIRWPSSDLIRVHLPARWAVELMVAGCVAGNAPPAGLLEDIGSLARPLLLDMARHAVDRPTSQAAEHLARSVPLVPAYRLRIEVLGQLRVWRDGTPVEATDLRRTRVRELLSLLVVRRRTRRESIGLALWPDAADPSHNLNVTLNYLQRVLQPERTRGEAPYFLKSAGDWLELVTDDHLGVDLWELEALLDAAGSADRAGSPGDALAAYRAALPLWRGDPLPDAVDEDSTDAERTHLQGRYVSGATRAGELMLAAGEIDEAIGAAASALRADETCEPAYRLLARSHLARGDRAAARTTLARCTAILDELAVTPDDSTLALLSSIQSV